MKRARIALVLGLCSCGPAGPAKLTLEAVPRVINARGEISTVTVTALDGNEKSGAGKVRVSSTFGSLVDRAEVTLSGGTATIDFSCDAAVDPGCNKTVGLTGEWVSDRVLVEGFTIVTVNPDAGTP